MKKQKKPTTLLQKIADKRSKRALRSKAKKKHRNGPGFKEESLDTTETK